MPKYILITIVLLMLASMHAGAGNSGQTTIRAAMGTSPRAADNQKVMIQAAVVPAKSAADTKPIAPPPALRAADWIAAWQAAREACPEASGMTIYYNDRSGPTLESIKVFACVDMKARGELLVITIKQPGQKEESVAIVRASDVVRIDVRKPSAPSSP